MTARKPAHPLIPADRVNGTDVYGKTGEKLGKIEDVAIDKISGEVAYAILTFGGLLGVGARYHAVPWKLLKYDVERRAYVVPMEKSDLEGAPHFNERELSGWNDEASREAIWGYYYPFGPFP
jgi:sporulation protein YlmC with PRC-barrel domain